MVLVTTNKARRLMYITYIDTVTAQELANARQDIIVALAEMPPGIKLLSDFGRMDSMDTDGALEIGNVMELLDQHGIDLVVRVFPDASKDIGLNILSLFHYKKKLRTLTCDTMKEAFEALEL